MRHNNIRRSNFDSFGGTSFGRDTSSTNYYDPDGADRYDPDGADLPTTQGTTRVNRSVPGQKMQINIQLNNPTAQKITFELFQAFNSSVDILKPQLVVGTYSRIPGLSFQGQAAYPNNIDIYDQSGNLMIRGAAMLPVATIGCSEYPYKSLVDTTKVLGFNILVTRVSVATQAQFANNIVYVKKTYAGLDIRNEINVRSYKRLINPAQLDIDVKASMEITGEAGIEYALEAGESVQWGLYINKWAKPSL